VVGQSEVVARDEPRRRCRVAHGQADKQRTRSSEPSEHAAAASSDAVAAAVAARVARADVKTAKNAQTAERGERKKKKKKKKKEKKEKILKHAQELQHLSHRQQPVDQRDVRRRWPVAERARQCRHLREEEEKKKTKKKKKKGKSTLTNAGRVSAVCDLRCFLSVENRPASTHCVWLWPAELDTSKKSAKEGRGRIMSNNAKKTSKSAPEHSPSEHKSDPSQTPYEFHSSDRVES
jgi:hypothetical protein